MYLVIMLATMVFTWVATFTVSGAVSQILVRGSDGGDSAMACWSPKSAVRLVSLFSGPSSRSNEEFEGELWLLVSTTRFLEHLSLGSGAHGQTVWPCKVFEARVRMDTGPKACETLAGHHHRPITQNTVEAVRRL